jgi:hypothetical protein
MKSVETDEHAKSSLDLTQRLERRLAGSNASSHVLKRWILEISTLIISTLCMLAIVGIYFHIKGKDMSKSEVLLNCANILGKIASATLIIPTSEALGQLKWSWFNQSNAMWDFEIFDKATRGPWGAALLLYRTKGRSLAAFGALLIVLLLAIDTFFQQVIVYTDFWELSSYGELPRVVRYHPFYAPEFFQGIETSLLDPGMRKVVEEAFSTAGPQPTVFGNGTRPNIPVSCPTSRCTWPKYETLGVCSQCRDAAEMLDFACLYTRIDWSASRTGPLPRTGYANGTVCGYFLNVTSNSPVLMSGYVVSGNTTNHTDSEVLLTRALPLTEMINKTPLWEGSVGFKSIRHPILDAIIVSASDGVDSVLQGRIPVAHECVLAWCVKTVLSTYNDGNYEENVSSTFLNITTEHLPWPWTSYPVHLDGDNGTVVLWGPDINIDSPSSRVNNSETASSDTPYGVDNMTVSNIVQTLDDYFPSYYLAGNRSQQPMLRYKDYLSGPSYRRLEFNPFAVPNNFTEHMERVATAMTNAVRSNAKSSIPLIGPAYNKIQIVSVKWEWLIFPFVLLLLSLTFLVCTIRKTSRDTSIGVWKTSALPSLIYGLPDGARSKFTPSGSPGILHGDSKQLRIKLSPDNGWRLSGQSLLKTPLLPERSEQPPGGWV